MQYVPIVPEPPLSHYVEAAFYLGEYCPECPIERLVPDGACSLVIELDSQVRWIADNDSLEPVQYCSEGWFSGPHTHFISISALQNTELVAVRFCPGGLDCLLQDDLSKLINRVVPASELVGNQVADLRDLLIGLSTAEEKLQTTLRWLEQRMNFEMSRPPAVDDVIKAIQKKPTVSTISDVIDSCGFTRKHLVNLFRKHVGLRPKEFQRILRFNRALAEIQKEQPISWTNISNDCGYSDQAHFIRDFRQFSGMNPTKFLKLETDRVNFFPIESDESSDAQDTVG